MLCSEGGRARGRLLAPKAEDGGPRGGRWVLSPCLFNFYAEYIMRNAGLEEPREVHLPFGLRGKAGGGARVTAGH